MAQQGEWYYQIMGEIRGPVTSTQLKRATDAGTIEHDTLVRRGTSGDWALAERISGLFETPTTGTPSSTDVASQPSATPTASHRTESARIYKHDVRPERIPLRKIDRFFFLAVRGVAYVAIAALAVTGFIFILVLLRSERPRPINLHSYEEIKTLQTKLDSEMATIGADEDFILNTIIRGRPVPLHLQNAMKNEWIYKEVNSTLLQLIDAGVTDDQVQAFVDNMEKFLTDLESDGGRIREEDTPDHNTAVLATTVFVSVEAVEIRRFIDDTKERDDNNAVVFDRLTYIVGLFCFVVLVLVILAIERNTRDVR